MNSLQNIDPSDLSNQSEKMLKRPCRQHESFIDKADRFRGLFLVILIPIILISVILFLVPRFLSNSFAEYTLTNPTDFHINRFDHSFPVSSLPSSSRKYAVIFDAGSSGSRVHVFCFNGKLDLVPIGNDLELFLQIKPGLSAYAADPQMAAESLVSLLERAENAIPPELQASTPVRVGATAGLRTLEGDRADRILQAVRDLLKKNCSLKSNPEWVSVLDGAQEGSFQWVTINFLLGNIGNKFSDTVGVVDLGGGSVQMAYAISEKNAAKAPRPPSVGEDSYVKEMYLKGVKYHLYVHSYLHYGLLAARAEILKAHKGSDNPCVLAGYHGTYKYGGHTYGASASPSGSSMEECREVAIKALDINGSTCTHMKCTFGGVWNGGGGDGQRNLFVASFFFDRASEAGFVNSTANVVKVRPADFEDAAKRACGTSLEDAGALYPSVEADNLPYLCMDLVYQFTLLVDGFALNPWQVITLVKKVKYRNFAVEAAWPLGSAIEAASF